MILYIIDFLCKLFGMDTQEKIHPAYTYIEAVTKRASEEGFKLSLSNGGFIWRDSKGNIFGDGQVWNLNIAQLIHQACIFLDDNQNWKITG